MCAVIIGTAGHIDHGKTMLIRALTGRDTDTLKEEKQRGITIDLGFTWFDLPGGERAGIIDVPGHEKFLPNMLAGVCGMDLVLVTIAADEGIMPQTKEHLNILSSLEVPAGILVLTKCDRIEPDRLPQRQQEITDALKHTMFAAWPVVCVSAVTGYGMEDLNRCIAAQAKSLVRNRDDRGRFRLPVDRVLSPKGIGTVAAGTLLSGHLHAGDPVEIYPGGMKTRIKSLQVHGESCDEAAAGQRTAILLAGVDKKQLKRGMTAAYPGSLSVTGRIDARLTLYEDCARTVKNQSRVHLYTGTAETICRAVLLSRDELKAGESDYVQLITDDPLAVKKKDRFVIRFLSPAETIGGGVILNELAPKHRRRDADTIQQLKDREEEKNSQIILAYLARFTIKPATVSELAGVGMAKEQLVQEMDRLAECGQCVKFSGRKHVYYWTIAAEEQLWEQLRGFLGAFHQAHPFLVGTKRIEIKNNCFPTWDAARVDAYLSWLLGEGRITTDSSGTEILYARSDFQLIPDEKMKKFTSRVLKTLQKKGMDLVEIDTLKTDIMSSEEFSDRIAYLEHIGKLVHVTGSLYMTPRMAAEVRERVERFFASEERISYGTLRDILGTSRKSAKPMMLWLDVQGLTSWCGKETERMRGPKCGKETEKICSPDRV